MEKVIHKYETIFIVDASLPEDSIKAIVEKFTKLISDNATIESVDEWGKRKLAYEINKLKEGYYVLINFACNAEFPLELERIYKITDGIIRNLVIRKDPA